MVRTMDRLLPVIEPLFDEFGRGLLRVWRPHLEQASDLRYCGLHALMVQSEERDVLFIACSIAPFHFWRGTQQELRAREERGGYVVISCSGRWRFVGKVVGGEGKVKWQRLKRRGAQQYGAVFFHDRHPGLAIFMAAPEELVLTCLASGDLNLRARVLSLFRKSMRAISASGPKKLGVRVKARELSDMIDSARTTSYRSVQPRRSARARVLRDVDGSDPTTDSDDLLSSSSSAGSHLEAGPEGGDVPRGRPGPQPSPVRTPRKRSRREAKAANTSPASPPAVAHLGTPPHRPPPASPARTALALPAAATGTPTRGSYGYHSLCDYDARAPPLHPAASPARRPPRPHADSLDGRRPGAAQTSSTARMHRRAPGGTIPSSPLRLHQPAGAKTLASPPHGPVGSTSSYSPTGGSGSGSNTPRTAGSLLMLLQAAEHVPVALAADGEGPALAPPPRASAARAPPRYVDTAASVLHRPVQAAVLHH